MDHLHVVPRAHLRRAFLPLLVLVAALAAASPPAHGASAGAVVSQVYAGGGNSGAAYQNDFVELFNRGSSAVDLAGWTIQYATASGTSWQATPLSGSLAPGRHYLVQLASAAAVGAALPTPDATGTTNLAASGGKIALVRDATVLSCGAAAGSCASVASIQDLVGYGTAADFEGSAAVGALSNTSAAVRAGAGCTDTDANASDFSVSGPDPRNTSAATTSCGAAPPPDPGTSQGATVDADVQPVLGVSLERATLSFGQVVAGSTPAPLAEHVVVTSNRATGYTLTVHRSAFTPSDLPLGLSATAPAGGTLNPALGAGATLGIPVAPAADLLIGTTAVASPPAGDSWSTSIGFTGPLPSVAPGHYAATVTYTAIGR
jgi:hypothetical protein